MLGSFRLNVTVGIAVVVGIAGLSYVLVRRLREITWAVVGFLALGAERPAA